MIGLDLKAFLMFVPVVFLAAMLFTNSGTGGENVKAFDTGDMVFIEGGAFKMGDVFGDGGENERPVHEVTLADFYLARNEVTVSEFGAFVEETGYKTSAEGPVDKDALEKIMNRVRSGGLTREEMQNLQRKILLYAGAGFWDSGKTQWVGYNPETNWRNPGFEQTSKNPVVAVSVDDARNYCNWLSGKAGLPVAYDLATGGLLDKDGRSTIDITAVAGYRLPTEAEWEYAAREKGRRIRFGDGKDIARPTEINFRADGEKHDYAESGDYRKGTSPVGNYPPNSLGLFDMSGNAWEWTGDGFAGYDSLPRVNPYLTGSDMHALRGGRWGGDAFEARVFHRTAWVRNDRCNNSGFRVARSATIKN